MQCSNSVLPKVQVITQTRVTKALLTGYEDPAENSETAMSPVSK